MPATPDTTPSPAAPERGPTGALHGLGDGWTAAGGFLESILAGFLLGFLIDWWLDTGPWPIIVGIVLGSYSGFMKLWRYSKRIEEDR